MFIKESETFDVVINSNLLPSRVSPGSISSAAVTIIDFGKLLLDGVNKYFSQQIFQFSIYIKQLLHPVYAMQQYYDIYNQLAS